MNTENNKLIAKFLGDKIYLKDFDGYQKPLLVFNSKDLIFDKDWNHLMQVVEKIESLTITETYDEFNEKTVCAKVSLSIENAFCQILTNGMYLNEIVSIGGNSKIEAVYNACIFFIKWYNEKN